MRTSAHTSLPRPKIEFTEETFLSVQRLPEIDRYFRSGNWSQINCRTASEALVIMLWPEASPQEALSLKKRQDPITLKWNSLHSKNRLVLSATLKRLFCIKRSCSAIWAALVAVGASKRMDRDIRSRTTIVVIPPACVVTFAPRATECQSGVSKVARGIFVLNEPSFVLIKSGPTRRMGIWAKCSISISINP